MILQYLPLIKYGLETMRFLQNFLDYDKMMKT